MLERVPLELGSTDVFDRLLRKNHEQKSWFDQSEHIEETLLSQNPDQETKELLKVKQIFGINYDFHPDSESDAFVAEFSFTVLDWIILDKILHPNKPFTLNDIDSK